MTRPILYSDDVSSPCRTVLLVADILGVELDIRITKLMEGQTLAEDFKKVNPQHTIPTLNDNGFIIWESHAIICYLAEKYGKDDRIYPKDLEKRAIIHQRLYFDAGVLFANIRGMTYPIIAKGKRSIEPERIELIEEAYSFLDKFLEGKKWLVGDDTYTLADISCLPSVTSLDVFHPIAAYPNIVRWVKTCEKELPGYDKHNRPGNDILRKAMKSLLGSKI